MRRKESPQNDPEVKNGATVNMIKVEENVEPIDKLINYVAAERELREAIQRLDNDKIEKALQPKSTLWI